MRATEAALIAVFALFVGLLVAGVFSVVWSLVPSLPADLRLPL